MTRNEIAKSLDMIPRFPAVIDSTIRSNFVSCQTKWFYEYILNRRPSTESPDLVAGGAFAAGLEAARLAYFVEGVDSETALAAGVAALIKKWGDYEMPVGHVKQLDRMIGALDYYFTTFGWETDHIQPFRKDDPDGRIGVEFSFNHPLPVDHPDTGEPLIYAGRFDLLGLYNGSLFVVDEKTTKQLGSSWHKNWTMRSQFTGYCWGAKNFGYPVAGAIVRGVSILKTKYGHAESIQYRPQHIIDRWYDQLIIDVKAMVEAYKRGQYNFDLDSACASYGGCAFVDACSAPSPEHIIQRDTHYARWDPTTHQVITEENQ